MIELLVGSVIVISAIVIYYYSKKNKYRKPKKAPFHERLKIK